jgi:hypothetical protein
MFTTQIEFYLIISRVGIKNLPWNQKYNDDDDDKLMTQINKAAHNWRLQFFLCIK